MTQIKRNFADLKAETLAFANESVASPLGDAQSGLEKKMRIGSRRRY
jgi:hypothetical protein